MEARRREKQEDESLINHLVGQRYEVLEKIGEGPLFTVYKARDKSMNRVVALKTVAGAFGRDMPFLQGLERGLASAASLNHAGIARQFETGEYASDNAAPAFYAISEFVRGINLKERIRRIAPFTLSVAIDVACAVGEALQYAHNMGMAHGDLRPHNIIMSPEGGIKVTDFGVMTGVAASPRAQADVLGRASAYHAPELSTTQPGTPSGDIYALGAVLYEMLTGTPLYSGDTLDAVADLHAFAPIPLSRVLNPGVPRSVEGIIVKCLQKRPDARYLSATDLLTDLKAVRDALRFGKPLSWSPVDVDKLANDVPARPAASMPSAPALAAAGASAGAQAAVKSGRGAAKAPANTAGADFNPAIPDQANPMPAKNRLRETDERVSIYLKIAIGAVTGLILVCLLGIAGIYSSKWIDPETVVVPKLVGKSIDEVRLLAQQKKLHLLEHAEYVDKPRGIVFRTDETDGEKLHEGHDVNVWYSKGSIYVPVPNVVGLSREQAEQTLKDAGLTLGKVTPEYSAKVAANMILRQNVSYKKQVLHDQAVDLVISDGPKPDYGTEPGTDAGNTPAPNPDSAPGDTPSANNEAGTSGTGNSGITGADTGSDPNANPNPPDDPGNSESHEFRRVIRVPKDGKGPRKVRVEFVDANGLSITPVADESHEEGDAMHVQFTYYGKKITLRVFYDGQLSWTKTFDPAATKNEVVR